MTLRETVEKILKTQNLKKAVLADRMQVKAQAVNTQLKRGNMNSKNLIKTLKVLDYKLVAVPRGKKLSEDCFEIDTE